MNSIPLPGLFLFLLSLILLSGFFSGSETALMTLNAIACATGRSRATRAHCWRGQTV